VETEGIVGRIIQKWVSEKSGNTNWIPLVEDRVHLQAVNEPLGSRKAGNWQLPNCSRSE
jgi:hypothetical protein